MSRHILEQVRDQLMEHGLISSNREFCYSWLARDESYMRGLRFRNMPPSVEALNTLASKLAYYSHHLSNSNSAKHQQWCRLFDQLHEQCMDALEQLAREQWMTPQRMGL